MVEVAKVGIIGGGRTGAPLIRDFLKYDYIQIMGVADVNSDAEGMRIARENNVYTTTDAMDLAKMGEDIDIIIEVSGDPPVKSELKEYYQRTDNKHTIIVHDLVARLMISMANKSDHLMRTYHPQDDGIGK